MRQRTVALSIDVCHRLRLTYFTFDQDVQPLHVGVSQLNGVSAQPGSVVCKLDRHCRHIGENETTVISGWFWCSSGCARMMRSDR